jgi:hypothetical protein
MQEWHKELRPETAAMPGKQEKPQEEECQRGPEADHSAAGH